MRTPWRRWRADLSATGASSPHEAAARRLTSDPQVAERLALDILDRAPGDVRARLVLGAARRRLGDLEGACALLEPLALAYPDAGFARTEAVLSLAALAEAAAERGRWAEAEAFAARRLALDPTALAARRDQAAILLRAGRAADALDLAQRLVADHPGDVQTRALAGACQVVLGDADAAVASLGPLVVEAPEDSGLWLTLGHALKTAGAIGESAQAYRRARDLGVRPGEALWSLANLKTVALTAADRTAISRALAKPGIAPREEIALLYAQGRALEERRSWKDAFTAYARGAALRRRLIPHDAAGGRRRMREMRAVLDAELFHALPPGGAVSREPIFIVGLPRSGSTLIEQILASHPDVEGTAELPYLTGIARRLEARGGYARALAALTPLERTALGEAYLVAAGRHRRRAAARFIDKAPSNFHHVGLIRLILPGATIIDAHRHPLSCGFSVFTQLFASGHDWSYDLSEIGAHLRDYRELMRHFDVVQPGAVIRVAHEDLVSDLEGQVRDLLEACGLSFHSACLRFWETSRPVASASAAQVRQPLDRRSAERWRPFRTWLAPLEAALAEEGEA